MKVVKLPKRWVLVYAIDRTVGDKLVQETFSELFDTEVGVLNKVGWLGRVMGTRCTVFYTGEASDGDRTLELLRDFDKQAKQLKGGA